MIFITTLQHGDNMTTEEVRAYFRLESVETVRRWHSSGRLRGFKLAHNMLLFKRADVLAFEQERIKESQKGD